MVGVEEKKEKVFRFSRADFGPLDCVPLHYDLDFDFPLDSTDVKVTSRQTYMNKTSSPCSSITLDAHDLKLEAMEFALAPTPLGEPPIGLEAKVPDFIAHVKELDGLTFKPVKYDYDNDKRKIVVSLPSPVAPNGEFSLRTVSVCSPNDKTLEGMYFDFTPEGQPQTIISQNQQYGFQRIVPCIDTMTGKTFYTTKMTANSKYTNLVSNGDLVGEYTLVEEGKRKQAIYHNHKVNMAPYLFFIGVGTYETYKSEVEYPTGLTFDVELLALPGVIEKKEDGMSALKSLVDSIIWMQLSTGPEKYEHNEERDQVYALIKERDQLKASGDAEKLAAIREKLKELMKAWKETGYVYTGSCYREIGMENSNYGGMENVGNTTILSSRLTPSKWLVDGGHVYMEGVKIHEFYHNINGSQVTGSSPFEIWLNEAVTVHVQREREDEIFGHDYMRLGQVIYARMPGTGPLALDRAPSSMAVEPEGFNTTHELVSAMTYSKAPEYVRMTQSLIGKENFVKALIDYHTKYAFSNAVSGEWVDEMAAYQPEGVDLRKMAHGWLKRTGYPVVTVTKQTFAEGKMTVELSQTGFEEKTDDNSPWIIPVAFSAVVGGESVKSGVWVLQKPSDTFAIEIGLSGAPDFVSLGCDWSFYGELVDKSSTLEQRFIQAKSDPDTINRYLAFQAILDDEKANLVGASRDGATDGLVGVSEGVVELYGSVLNDNKLSDATKGRFLGIGSSCPSRPEVSHYYWALSFARKSILKAVGKRYIKELTAVWERTAKDSSLQNRNLKFAVFSAIRASGEVENGALREMVRPMLGADNMSDRSFALRVLLELGEKEAKDVAKKAWVGHTIGCEQYIATISSVDSDDTPALIRELIEEPFFNLALAGHARTMSRAWCGNMKRALLTKEGLELTKDLFLRVGKVNQMSAYGFIGTFSQANKFEDSVKNALIGALKDMRGGLDPEKQESLYNQTGRLLTGLC